MSLRRYRIFGLAALAFLLAGCDPSSNKVKLPAAQPAATAPVAVAPAAPQPPPPPAVPQQTEKERRVQQLIEQVEKSYAAGDADYRRGRLPEAKEEFDHAVDLMLTSGIDIKSEPQLQDEFDHIIDQVNALEMEALKQGNGFAPKIEPAPVDIANDVTFPVDPTVKAQAIAELKTTQSDLPLVINDPVAGFISYFSSKGR